VSRSIASNPAAPMRHKIDCLGGLRDYGLMGIAGKAEIWFGRKLLQIIDLNSKENEFWFGTLWQNFRDAYSSIFVSFHCEMI
jgi:hypothetical protein